MTEYQRVWAEINLDNIAHNIKEIRKKINENSKIMSIVKADAYGHGAIETSKVLLYNGSDSLGVAISDEGVKLRQNNIHVPILVLGYTPDLKLEDVVINNLTQTIFSFEMAQVLSQVAVRLNIIANIHIKIDTGMSRLGFRPDQSTLHIITQISKLQNIKITGIYTHFATSDMDDMAFTYEQYEKFNDFIKLLEKNNIKIPYIHVSNSGGIIDSREFDFDIVRPGIILYGLYPSKRQINDAIKLLPAMSLKTRISFIKEVEENTSISYSRTFFTNKKTIVATIPVGYADGYARDMSNKGRVLIGGEYANILGNVCMDQFMVDITNIKNVRQNDEVVLIGKQGDKEITIEEIADIQKTINYEIVCNIGKRVPRVYIKNNNFVKTVNL